MNRFSRTSRLLVVAVAVLWAGTTSLPAQQQRRGFAVTITEPANQSVVISHWPRNGVNTSSDGCNGVARRLSRCHGTGRPDGPAWVSSRSAVIRPRSSKRYSVSVPPAGSNPIIEWARSSPFVGFRCHASMKRPPRAARYSTCVGSPESVASRHSPNHPSMPCRDGWSSSDALATDVAVIRANRMTASKNLPPVMPYSRRACRPDSSHRRR